MNDKFILKCNKCGEYTELEENHPTGNLNNSSLIIEIDQDENNLEDIEVNFHCQKCDNYFYITK